MSELILPLNCQSALAALESNPLEPGAEAEAHLRTCGACREAQVMLVAQEEAPLPLVQAGYFDRLPARVIGKLQTRKVGFRPGVWWMAAAAVLTLAVGTGAFMAGRANRTPLVEAKLNTPASTSSELVPEAPFQDQEDALAQLAALPAEEADAVIQALATKQSQAPMKK